MSLGLTVEGGGLPRLSLRTDVLLLLGQSGCHMTHRHCSPVNTGHRMHQPVVAGQYEQHTHSSTHTHTYITLQGSTDCCVYLKYQLLYPLEA